MTMHAAIATRVMQDTPDGSVASLVYRLINNEEGNFGLCYAIAFTSADGCFEAGLVFNNYHPEYRRVEVNIASVKKNWLTLGRLVKIMEVPLLLDCEVVVSKTDPSNRDAIQLMERCGAKSYRLADVRGVGKEEIYQVLLMKDMMQTKFWRKIHGR